MMGAIPRAPLLLGLAGLLPFIAGAAISIAGSPETGPLTASGHPLVNLQSGPAILIAYGTVILSFMSGVLWGFATRSGQPLHYVLSVIPALWAFFNTGTDFQQLIKLMVGFILLRVIEQLYIQARVTPDWWQPLRTMLTIAVLVCLYCGTFAAPAG